MRTGASARARLSSVQIIPVWFSDFAAVSGITRDEGDTEPRFHRNSAAGSEFQLGLVSPAVS